MLREVKRRVHWLLRPTTAPEDVTVAGAPGRRVVSPPDPNPTQYRTQEEAEAAREKLPLPPGAERFRLVRVTVTEEMEMDDADRAPAGIPIDDPLGKSREIHEELVRQAQRR